MYTELDFTFLGLKVLNVGVLIAEELNQVLDKEHQTKLPGTVGWNLIQLSYNMFIEKNVGQQDSTHLYVLKESTLYYFFQLCIFHYSEVQKNQTLGTSKVMSQQIKHGKSQNIDDLSKKRPVKLWRKRWSHRTGHYWFKRKPCLCPW